MLHCRHRALNQRQSLWGKTREISKNCDKIVSPPSQPQIPPTPKKDSINTCPCMLNVHLWHGSFTYVRSSCSMCSYDFCYMYVLRDLAWYTYQESPHANVITTTHMCTCIHVHNVHIHCVCDYIHVCTYFLAFVFWLKAAHL